MPRTFYIWGDPKMGPTALVSSDGLKEHQFGEPERGDVILHEFELADVFYFKPGTIEPDEDKRWYTARQFYEGFAVGWLIRDKKKTVADITRSRSRR